MFRSSSICCLLLLIGRVAADAAAAEGTAAQLTVVSTAQGDVTGSYNATSGVYRYLGIPYGDDTSGSNRFLAPKPAPRRKASLDATQFGPACPQLLDESAMADMLQTGNRVPGPSGQSEDCLKLNIWVDSATRSAAGKKTGAPVLLFIHGGTYIWGATSSPLFDANRFVQNQKDLIVITFDYRLNILGNPRAPQLKNTSDGWNLSLLDRDAAISWVRKNVASFGGDPNRITLWGQSSGGASVDLWAMSHANGEAGSKDIAGLIIESGAVTSLNPINELSTLPASSNPVSVWYKIAKNVGCGSQPRTKAQKSRQFTCMQKVPWAKLINATAAEGPIFIPQPDGKTFFDNLTARSSSGRFAKVPTLIGSNTHEGAIVGGSQKNDSASAMLTDTLLTAPVYTCGASNEAADRVTHGVRTFRYRYDGNWDDINSGRPELGAFHGSELSLLFGIYGPSPIGNWGKRTRGPRTVAVPAAEDAVATYLQTMWASFARDPHNGLPARGWPAYDLSTKSLAFIARNNDPKPHYVYPDVLEGTCDAGVDQIKSAFQTIMAKGIHI